MTRLPRVRFLRFAICAVTVLGVTGSAVAQTCAGSSPISRARPISVGGSAQFTPNLTVFGGSVTLGSDNVFGTLDVGRAIYDELDDASSFVLSGTAGAQVGSSVLAVCPFFTVGNEFGPNDVFEGLDISTLTLGGGVAVGIVAADTGGVRIVPTGRFAIIRARATFEFEGDSESESDTVGLIAGGVGFILKGRFGITPQISYPLGLDDADLGFSISVSYSFGR